jgi:hypothetical protein
VPSAARDRTGTGTMHSKSRGIRQLISASWCQESHRQHRYRLCKSFHIFASRRSWGLRLDVCRWLTSPQSKRQTLPVSGNYSIPPTVPTIPMAVLTP